MHTKNQTFPVRLTEYEAKQLKYVSKQAGLSRAEVLRLGLQAILHNSPPSEVPKLKKFFTEGE